MELKRILAKDSRRALEEVSQTFGDDALVISSGKVKLDMFFENYIKNWLKAL